MKETEQIKRMFDRIVGRYDFLNRLLSFGQDILWRKRMAREAVDSNTKIVLDLAVGTGDSAKEILRKGVKVIGVDISFEMLRVARKKKRIPLIPVTASGYSLPFKENTFDAVTCAFGIRNMHQTEVALKEIFRVLKNHGRIIILEFSLPENLFRKPYLFYLKKVVPAVASLFSSRSAYEYLGASIENFYKPVEFIKLLESCGFTDTKFYSLSFGTVYLYIAKKIKNP